jgi:hypothetical protein
MLPKTTFSILLIAYEDGINVKYLPGLQGMQESAPKSIIIGSP